jgi:hypothetical protein
MQTFVPHGSDFNKNALVLDRQRLGKQRVEGMQILNSLLGYSSGWSNHPAVKMWKGYEPALVQYTLEICKVWTSLGYKDTCGIKILQKCAFAGVHVASFEYPEIELPEWLDDVEVMESHKSNLLRKLPNHYSKYWPEVSPDLPYKWPINNSKGGK